jgi:tRNA threonylcarbamoyl adenosine modification protein YeaZ
MLSIDTSAGTSVAILRGNDVLAEANIASSMMHVESIGTAIAQALALAGLAGKDIEAVVVGRGPAPFTGLRVGLAAGTVFAQAVGAQLYGAVSLDALAWSALQDARTAAKVSARTPLLVTADARRSEVYWALYSGLSAEGLPLRADLPAVNKPATLDELLVDRNVEVVRAGIPANNELTDGADLTLVPIATALGRVAQALLITDALSHDTSPLYLRAPDAVLPKPHARYGKAEYSKPVISAEVAK